ncbi:MAG: selenocysteine-specific translation elongation factor [Planctomycetota bacterium]
MPDSAGSKPVVSVVVGTAGHIDHGKSSLIEQLTGTHPSRLKEEQERGMTIDIGYAELPLSETATAGIIDVPGHEKFIRNMVAGATGVDFGLMVVAADDGVMTQTREHLQIMRLLGIERGATVITKIDAVDSDLQELVKEEIAEFLEGTFLEDAPMFSVSNTTGEGIDEFRTWLIKALSEIPPRPEGGVFRMPIQRSFSVKGHGTVVTGVPVTGKVRVGDELELLPKGKKVRTRGLQVHHQPAEEASVGHRTALNITDVNWKEVNRGDVLATPGYFSTASMLEARLEYLDHHPAPMRNDVPVRFHTGTADVGGRVIILDKKVILPGESALVQIRLEEPVVVAANDRYIVRLASPVITLGGGVIVGETKWRFKRMRDWLNENLEQKEAHLGDELGYLEYVIRSQGKVVSSADDLALAIKGSRDETITRLESLIEKGRVVSAGTRRGYVHADMFDAAAEDLGNGLLRLHKADPLQAGFQPNQITRESHLELELVEALVAHLIKKKKLEILGRNLIRHRKFSGGLSREDLRLVTRVEAMHAENPFASPIFSAIVEDLGKPVKKVKELMGFLHQMGTLIPIASDLSLHTDAVQEAERLLVARISSGGPMPSKEFKDIVATTRKYVIPLLEYFDKKGVTARDGNDRNLTPNWREKCFAETAEANPEN